MRSFFFFFLLSLFLFTFHSATGNIIYETCRTASRENQNVNYNFCKTSLLAIPAAQRSNLQKLGLASINLLEKNIASTMTDIKKVLKKKALNKNVKKYSTTCLDIFTQTLDDLKDTVDNYKSKNFYEVNQDIIEISRAAKSCDDGFADVGVVSPLKKSNDNTSQLATIALKIIDLYAKAN